MPSPLFRLLFGKTLKSSLSRSTSMVLSESIGPDVPAGDVIPNAINWGDVSWSAIEGGFYYAVKQITGIDQTITIKVNTSTAAQALWYRTSTTTLDLPSDNLLDGGTPTDYGMTQINNNGTFTVSNNRYIAFGVKPPSTAFGSMTVTVRNNSNADTVLDTFTASWDSGYTE